MKRLIIGITVLVACHVGNVEAAQWMPLDEAEDRQLIRTNQSPEEGHIICTSKTRGNGQGIAKDGRRLGFLTKKGCKTIGGGDKVRWFKRENGDIMVLVDDEPAVQDDAQNEGEDYQARYEEARDAAAKAVQQLQEAQEWTSHGSVDSLSPHYEAASKASGLMPSRWVCRRIGL